MSPLFRAWWLLCCLAGVAASAGAETATVRRFQRPEGMSSLAVNALAQDSAQRLYVGTENGLLVYDGDQMVAAARPVPGGPERRVTALASDDRGRVWIGTHDALLLWRPGAPVAERAVHRTVKPGTSLAVAADRSLWFLGIDALFQVQDQGASLQVQSWKPPPDVGALHAVAAAKDGMWLACGEALCRFDGQRWLRLAQADGVPAGGWRGLLVTPDGAVWAASSTQVIHRAPGQPRFTVLPPLPRTGGVVRHFHPLQMDAAGRLLVAGDDSLLRWDGQRWTVLGAAQGLDSAAGLTTLLLDAEGDLWLGTAGQGLNHWRGYHRWRSWTTADGLPSASLWAFQDEADGRVWVGSDKGPARLDPDSGRVEVLPGAEHLQISRFARSTGGTLWAGSFNGRLLRLHRGRWQTVGPQLAMVQSLQALPDGALLVGTEAGLWRVPQADAETPRLEALRAMDSLPEGGRGINTMCSTADGVWLATWHGLFRWEATDRLARVAVAGLPAETSVAGLGCADAQQRWLVLDDNSLWRLRRTEQGWQAQRERSPLLDHRAIVSMEQDSRLNLWLGTDDGLLLRTGETWHHFSEADGLVWSDLNGGALFEDRRGRLWVGTSRGVSLLADPAAALRFPPLNFSLEAVRQGDRRWAVDTALKLPWSTEPLVVDWRVQGLAGRAATQVFYRLSEDGDAADDPPGTWRQGTAAGLRFEVLPAGRHALQAYAEHPGRGQRSPVVGLVVEVLPPWWRSGPALLAAGLLSLGLVAAGLRWRVRRLLRRQRELEDQVALRTQDLVASHEAMRQLALTDALTGAMNRRAIMEAAERELERVRRGEGPLVLALVDIDHFKRINDRWGHPAGDAVLCETVARLRAASRPYDLVGRYGGEEFLVLLPGVELQGDDAPASLLRLHQAVSVKAFELGGEGDAQSITCSIGATGLKAGEPGTLAALIAHADQALYRAKGEGRNRVVL